MPRPLPTLLLFTLASCGPPSATIRPTVPAEAIGAVNDNALTYQGHLAAGLETGAERSITPRSCEVLPAPRGPGELRVFVVDPDQTTVLDLSGEALRNAWSSCTCGTQQMPHCVHIPPAPPPVTR